jgi:two-component system phosphate regulon sensor histidine kinase PhoR
MNKKKLFITNLLFFIAAFLLFLAASLTSFLVATTNVKTSAATLSDEVNASLKIQSDYDATLAKYRGIADYRLSYFTASTPTGPSSDSWGVYENEAAFAEISAKVDQTYFEKNASSGKELCYVVRYHADSATYVRSGVLIPSIVPVSRGFLIYGSIAFVLGGVTYLILSYRRYSKSMLALKSQVNKLQAITAKDQPTAYDDNLEFFALMIRNSRKELDAQLTAAKTGEQKINFILDSFSQGLVVVDATFHIVMFNKKASEIFSLPKEAADGASLSVLSKGPKVEKNLSLVLKTLIPVVYYENIDGRIYECDINPIDYSWTRVNEKSGASLLMFDVTDSFNSSKMKRDFFANASHELKSPLTSILGYQEMIRDHIITTPEEFNDANAKTIKEAKRMRKIILNMLELSSLENENLRPIEQINVSREIAAILASLEIEIKERGIEVHQTNDPLIIGINPDDFDKLMRNLLENAIKYNKEHGEIFIRVSAKDKVISVRDTGIGISEEDKTRIFERFYRVDKARSRENGGTGLGLAIVKYICNYYDYGIDVDSALGHGTTFTVHVK